MKAAFKKGLDIYLKEMSMPGVGPDEIRLKVDACGICGTDLHLHPGEQKEHKFGHEVAGTILETGSAVLNVKAGQKVVLESSSACGVCDACRNARQELCANLRGSSRAGTQGMAEEMIAAAIAAIPYESLSPEVACLQEPLGVAIDVVRLAEIEATSNVLVVGLGPIGLMALALAKREGARKIFACELKNRSSRIRLAKRFGAFDVFDPAEIPLDKYAYGCGIDRILVTAPPRVLADTFKTAAKGGIVTFIGIEYGEGAFCRFDANDFHFKKLQLRASFAAPALYGPLALQYLREGVVDGEALISNRFPLSEIAEAMKAARGPDAIKVVVTA